MQAYKQMDTIHPLSWKRNQFQYQNNGEEPLQKYGVSNKAHVAATIKHVQLPNRSVTKPSLCLSYRVIHSTEIIQARGSQGCKIENTASAQGQGCANANVGASV